MDNREPRPSRCWQRTEDATPPSWIEFDLDEQCVDIGSWVLMHDEGGPHPHPILLSDEQFRECYE